jgi:hypothetical protein
MPSPFPGMNPYLEQADVWEDFHNSYLLMLREQLTPQVQPRYIAKIGEHLYIRDVPEERRLVGYGDVSLHSSAPGGGGTATAVLDAPAYARMVPSLEPERDVFLEILDRNDRRLITVIELLSPSNKYHGDKREQYENKRREYLSSSAHFVEIDLLRGGPRMPFDLLPDCDYYAAVSVAEARPRIPIWPIRVRDRLPVIPIPLRLDEPRASLDLQNALHRAFDSAGYGAYIYADNPEPRLNPVDATWARQFVPAPPTEAPASPTGS